MICFVLSCLPVALDPAMRIAVAMSGGVDSSVAAAVLVEQGHDVIGLSMQLYDQTGGERTFGSCCTLDDLHDARRVAAAIDIPHYILNLERQFDEQVVSNFVREYTAGRTPLPCARCNSDLKFATLLDRARGFGADAVATGHYAQVAWDERTGRYLLTRGVDPGKDQSYFLFSLTQAQLAHAVFPIGDLAKDAVREYARGHGLPVADKPDSHEICFVPDNDYAGFIAQRAPDAVQRRGDRRPGRPGAGAPRRHSRLYRRPAQGTRIADLAHRRADVCAGAQPGRSARSSSVRERRSSERSLTASGVNWIVEEPPARRWR